jgi:hypothetical protein
MSDHQLNIFAAVGIAIVLVVLVLHSFGVL